MHRAKLRLKRRGRNADCIAKEHLVSASAGPGSFLSRFRLRELATSDARVAADTPSRSDKPWQSGPKLVHPVATSARGRSL